MKIKKIFHDGVIYTIAHILTKGIGLLMIPFYTRYLSTSEYGLFDSIVIFGTFVSQIAGLEIHQSVARFFPETECKLEKISIVSTAFWLLCSLSLLLVIILLAFGGTVTNYIWGNQDYLFQIRMASISFGFMLLYNFMQAQLVYQLKVHANTIISFIYAISVALVAMYLIGELKMSIEAIFLAQTIGAVIGILLSYQNSKEFYSFSFSKPMVQVLLGFSIPLILSNLTLTLMVNIDRIIIADILTIAEVGLYGVAYRFAAVVSFGVAGFQTALTPLIYMHYKDKSTPQSIAKITHYFIGISICIVAGMYFLSSFIIETFTTVEYWSCHGLIPWIACSILLGGAINFAPGIFIAKKTKWVLYINLFCLFSNTVLNYLLIKSYGLIGAAYSTAVCSFIYLFLYYLIGQRYYFIPYFWSNQQRKPGEV